MTEAFNDYGLFIKSCNTIKVCFIVNSASINSTRVKCIIVYVIFMAQLGKTR